MFKHEEGKIFILVSEQYFSTDLHLQEVIFDTFLKTWYKGYSRQIKEHIILKLFLK